MGPVFERGGGVEKLEKVQNQALRFIFNKKGRVSFTELREEKSIESLQERKTRLREKMFYKVVGHDVNIDIGIKLNLNECVDDKPPAQCTRF